MSDTLTIDELPGFVASLPVVALQAARPAMQDTVLFLHSKIPPYPGAAPTGQTVKHMTPKARAWFFWVLKHGLLKLPYTRTGALGQSFTTEVSADSSGVTGQIGTNLSYAPWVVGPAYPGETIHGQTMYQAKIHQGRWWDFQEVMDTARPEAFSVFGQSFFDNFQRLLGSAA